MKTEEAAQAESEAEQQIYKYNQENVNYLAGKTWSMIRQGRDLEAIRSILSYYSTYVDNKPDYAVTMPDTVQLTDALRMALAMPQRQRSVFGYATDASFWEIYSALLMTRESRSHCS